MPETVETIAAGAYEHASYQAVTGRVLHVINGEHYAGAERVQDLLAARLPEFGFEVELACLKPGQFPEVRNSTAPLIELPMRSRLSLGAAWKLARIVRRGEFDLIHAHTPRSAMIAASAAQLTGRPLIYHVHSPTARDTTRPLRNWLNATTERVSLMKAEHLITVSQSLSRHMQAQGYPAEMITVVPNGVPGFVDLPPREAPRKQWTLGTVALFRPRKGTEMLIDALALLRDAGQSVRLRAVGGFETPEYELALKQRVAQHSVEEQIDWTGFTCDVGAELSQMDLFVLPSLFGEGLPMVVLEAMAAGLPVVGTDVEGVPEAIRNGVDGLIAKAGDAADLAAAIGRILRGEADWPTMSHAAQQRHAERFSDRAMAEGVAGVYRGVIQTGIDQKFQNPNRPGPPSVARK